MKYFFELLDSYKNRGCCVTRIDEKAKPKAAPKEKSYQELNQDFANEFSNIQIAINGMPTGATLQGGAIGTKTAKGIYKIRFTKNSIDTAQITQSGLLSGQGVALSDEKLKRFHTIYFGKQGSQEQEATEEQPEQIDQPQIPQMTPEEQAIADAVQELSNPLQTYLKGLWERLSGSRKCKIMIGRAIDVSQSYLRSRAKSEVSNIEKEVAEEAYKQFTSKPPAYCAALKTLQGVSRWNSLIMDNKNKFVSALTHKFGTVAIQQLAKIMSLNQAAIKLAFFEAKCPKNVKRADCIKLQREALTKDNPDVIAAIETYKEVVGYVTGEKSLPDDPDAAAEIREKIRQSMQFTRQGDIIIKAGASNRGIVISDKNRFMYDVMREGFKELGIGEPILHDLRERSRGAEIDIRGKLYEHLFPILGFLKKGDDKSLAKYMGELAQFCEFLGTMKEFTGAYEEGKASFSEADLQTLDSIRSEMESLDNCGDISKTLVATLGRAKARFDMMDCDFAVQVGADTQDGTRQDVYYGYDDPKKAAKIAKKKGLEVVKMTKGELMKLSPAYAEATGFDPKNKEDSDSVVYVIPDGLKTSTQSRSKFGSGGKAKIVSLLLGQFSKKPSEKRNQQAWLSKTQKGLGISGPEMKNAQKALKTFSSDLERDLKVIDGIKPVKTSVGGKPVRESPNSTIEELRKSRRDSLKGSAINNDPVIQNLDNLQDAIDSGDPEAVRKAKSDLASAWEEEKTRQFLSDAFKQDDNGAFVDKSKAHAAALMSVMSGSTNTDMSTTVAHLDVRGGSDEVVNHNTTVMDFMRRALSGDPKVKISANDPRDGYPDGRSSDYTVRCETEINGKKCFVDYIYSGSSIYTVVNNATISHFAGSSPAIRTESIVLGLEKLVKLQKFLLEKLSY